MQNTNEAKPLPVQSTVRGRIGGESHDSYVIYARAGQTMTVNLNTDKSPEEDQQGRAEFTLSRFAGFFESEPVDFGQSTADGASWSGKIPETADYYLYIVAHPVADYTLQVSIE
jgi:hypothetical protein